MNLTEYEVKKLLQRVNFVIRMSLFWAENKSSLPVLNYIIFMDTGKLNKILFLCYKMYQNLHALINPLLAF